MNGPVLVTGGTGFVGSHALVRLLRDNRPARTTVRSRSRGQDLRSLLDSHGVPADQLEIAAPDLELVDGIVRAKGAPNRSVSYGDLVLDDDTHEVWEGEREVELSPTEFNLLRYFLQNPGRVLSKRQILEHV